MKPAALLLVKDNPIVQRMIAAWPAVVQHPHNHDLTLKRWAKAAGLRELDVRLWFEMLIRNRIVCDKNYVNPTVEAFVVQLAMRGVTSGKKKSSRTES